jgi:hypothetical protein
MSQTSLELWFRAIGVPSRPQSFQRIKSMGGRKSCNMALPGKRCGLKDLPSWPDDVDVFSDLE